MYSSDIENKQSLEGVYKLTQTPTLSINKVDLWTYDSTTRTHACGIMWRFSGALRL